LSAGGGYAIGSSNSSGGVEAVTRGIGRVSLSVRGVDGLAGAAAALLSPLGYVPDADRGLLLAERPLPPAAS
jgi:hypothetical protein